MNTAHTIRRTVLASLIVPAIAFSVVPLGALGGMSSAQAQVSAAAPGGPGRGGRSSSSNIGPNGDQPVSPAQLPPCPIGAAAQVDCRPWSPPKQIAEPHDCSCTITYKVVDGQRVAVKDCYFQSPQHEVFYCRAGDAQ